MELLDWLHVQMAGSVHLVVAVGQPFDRDVVLVLRNDEVELLVLVSQLFYRLVRQFQQRAVSLRFDADGVVVAGEDTVAADGSSHVDRVQIRLLFIFDKHVELALTDDIDLLSRFAGFDEVHPLVDVDHFELVRDRFDDFIRGVVA